MHVVLVNLCYPTDAATADDLLVRFHNLGGWAEALVAEGAAATVVQRFHREESFERAGVRYRFVSDRLPADQGWWRGSRAVERVVLGAVLEGSESATVHVNGLTYGLQARAIRRRLPRAVPVVVQHHAEGPPGWPARPLLRRALRAVDGVMFTSGDLALPWRRAGLLASSVPVIEVVEGSTRFRRRPRAEARAETGLDGDPVVLWVGRLNPNKDPLTVLAGFEAALEPLPGARLYMAFHDPLPLLPAVERRIASSPRLQAGVCLLGAVPHDRIEAVLDSADLFVLGSRHEGSGFALIEAMACGVIPAVTEIPAFRTVTANGAVGSLWPPGDAAACAAAIVAAAAPPLEAKSDAVRVHFERRLSFPALARSALAGYRELSRPRR